MKRRLFSWLGWQAVLGILLLFGIAFNFFLFSMVNPYFLRDKNSSLILTIEFVLDVVLIFLAWQTFRYLHNIDKGMEGETEVIPTATLECIAKSCPCKMAVLQRPMTRGMRV